MESNEMKMTVENYSNRNGGAMDPEVVKEIHRIERKHTGMSAAPAVVDAARPETSRLHRYFEWNNDKAGESYRVWQARQLIATVHVTYINDRKPITVRAFVNVIRTNGNGDRERGYMGIAKVLSKSDLREQMLATALAEVNRWRERYASLTELADIFDAIDKINE
jgi:hypothetical protein